VDGPPEPLRFHSRVFHVAKDKDFENEYEDAFCVDESRWIAAIADGVSSSVFSNKWARILTQSVVENQPALPQDGAFATWLADRRAEWLSQIDFANLPYNLKAKLRQVGGAFSTLLWVEVFRSAEKETEKKVDEPFRFRAYATGDSCLFHVRGQSVLATFPLTTVSEFEADPITICSVNLNRDDVLQFQRFEGTCQAGDCLVLCTDALAKWAITRLERGEQVNWPSYWAMDEASWIDEITTLRDGHAMRRDDTTLVLLLLGESTAVADEMFADFSPAITEDELDKVISCTSEIADVGSSSGLSRDSEERCSARDEARQENVESAPLTSAPEIQSVEASAEGREDPGPIDDPNPATDDSLPPAAGCSAGVQHKDSRDEQDSIG
jgi:Protein phosphatase 2C